MSGATFWEIWTGTKTKAHNLFKAEDAGLHQAASNNIFTKATNSKNEAFIWFYFVWVSQVRKIISEYFFQFK